MPSSRTTKASIAAFFVLFVLAVSLPPKWATLHFAGLALVAAAGFARREDWHTPAMRTYLLCTLLWLVPVLLSAGLQNALGVATATGGLDLLVLVLRMLGIGLGLIILVQRGWLTLRSAITALLCALSIHVGAGLFDLFTTPDVSLTAWRQNVHIKGLVFNQNPFGMFMALTAILSAGLLRNQSSHRHALWTLLIASLVCVWASGSRGAILTTLVGLSVLFPPNNRKRLFFYAGSSVLMALAYLYVTQHMAPLFSGSNGERMMALSFSLEKIHMLPWVGWGIGAYEHFPDLVGPKAPHNMWLDLAVSSGVVALVGGLLSSALLVTRLYRQSRPAAQLALAVFIAALVAGTMEYSILVSTHFRGVWVLIVALACCTLNESRGSHEATNRAASPGNNA